MQQSLAHILEIQELDMQMMQLSKLKADRTEELKNLRSIKDDLERQVALNEGRIQELKKTIRLSESEVSDIVVKLKKLESQQNSVKKVDEFNALSQEIAAAERDRSTKEQRLSDMYDKLAAEEDLLHGLKSTLESTAQSSSQLEQEIRDRIVQINAEGHGLLKKREALAADADAEILRVYERLLYNKKDRVIVPIENRCCSGCHITITAQDENLVRKGERLIFCEHCSRIHYWPESEALEGAAGASKQRRRRAVKA